MYLYNIRIHNTPFGKQSQRCVEEEEEYDDECEDNFEEDQDYEEEGRGGKVREGGRERRLEQNVIQPYS